MRRLEILAGLPAYGPLAVPFPSDRWRAHSEGFVVRFRPENGDTWVGNFQRGGTPFHTVLEHPDGLRIVVFAGGMGYVVDPETREEISQGAADAMLSSGQVASAEHRPDLGILLFHDHYDYAALKADGGSWMSECLKWFGGPHNVAIRGDRLSAGVMMDSGRWLSVELDLNTGKHTLSTSTTEPPS